MGRASEGTGAPSVAINRKHEKRTTISHIIIRILPTSLLLWRIFQETGYRPLQHDSGRSMNSSNTPGFACIQHTGLLYGNPRLLLCPIHTLVPGTWESAELVPVVCLHAGAVFDGNCGWTPKPYKEWPAHLSTNALTKQKELRYEYVKPTSMAGQAT